MGGGEGGEGGGEGGEGGGRAGREEVRVGREEVRVGREEVRAGREEASRRMILNLTSPPYTHTHSHIAESEGSWSRSIPLGLAQRLKANVLVRVSSPTSEIPLLPFLNLPLPWFESSSLNPLLLFPLIQFSLP